MYDATRGANLSFGPLAKLGLNALSTPILRAAISARATLYDSIAGDRRSTTLTDAARSQTNSEGP